MISRIRWVLFMCSVVMFLVACAGNDSDPQAVDNSAIVEDTEPAPTPGFADAEGLREFIENDLYLYDDFLKETISASWKNDWTAYDNTFTDFALVDKLFKGTNPFASGTLTHYFSSAYPLLGYATITLDDLDDVSSPRARYFREDLIWDGSASRFDYTAKQRIYLAEARMYWGVKNVQYDGNDPNKPYVPFLILVDEQWKQRDGVDGEPQDWVAREYLLVFEGKMFAYGAPRVGNESWPYSSGVPGDAFEGEFKQIWLANYDPTGALAPDSEPKLTRSDHSYLLRQIRHYSQDSTVADVEPNDTSNQAVFVPIGYSSVTESHSLQVGSDNSDNFLITVIPGCDDGVDDVDPECANPVVLSTQIGVKTSDPTAQLKLELIDANGGFVIFDNVSDVAANGEKYIIFDNAHMQNNDTVVDNNNALAIGQRLIVRVSLANAGALAENATVNYRLRIVGSE